MRNLEGIREVLRRVKVDRAEETLGIHLAPDGNRQQQVQKML